MRAHMTARPALRSRCWRRLYAGRSAHEVLAMLLGDDVREGRALVRRQWQERSAGRRVLERRAAVRHDRRYALRLARRRPSAPSFLPGRRAQHRLLSVRRDPDLELLFRPDPTIGDGEWSNNGWLQELPKPLTQLTWENVALISPGLAEQRSLANGDVVELSDR